MYILYFEKYSEIQWPYHNLKVEKNFIRLIEMSAFNRFYFGLQQSVLRTTVRLTRFSALYHVRFYRDFYRVCFESRYSVLFLSNLNFSWMKFMKFVKIWEKMVFQKRNAYLVFGNYYSADRIHSLEETSW